MRKRIIQQIQPDVSLRGEDDWLKLEDLAEVEVTSEDTAHPIESALLPNHRTGWRAADPGYSGKAAPGSARLTASDVLAIWLSCYLALVLRDDPELLPRVGLRGLLGGRLA
jgi:hypothetical protein